MMQRGDRAHRFKKRMPCALFIDGARHTGFVLDVSTSGIFVQTSANPAPNSTVEVEIRPPGLDGEIRLRGLVARRKVVPPRLKAVAQAGIGVKLEAPPPEFFEYLATLMPGAKPPAGASSGRRR